MHPGFMHWWRESQRRASGEDGGPALLLRLGRQAKAAEEPLSYKRVRPVDSDRRENLWTGRIHEEPTQRSICVSLDP